MELCLKVLDDYLNLKCCPFLQIHWKVRCQKVTSKLKFLDFSFNSLVFNTSLHQNPLFQAIDLRLTSCKLGPQFPHWLRIQKGLENVDMSDSRISDVIPNWFWNLNSFFVWLNFSNNNMILDLRTNMVRKKLIHHIEDKQHHLKDKNYGLAHHLKKSTQEIRN